MLSRSMRVGCGRALTGCFGACLIAGLGVIAPPAGAAGAAVHAARVSMSVAARVPGHVPDPLSADWLEARLARIGVSADQRREIEGRFADYQVAFRAKRDALLEKQDDIFMQSPVFHTGRSTVEAARSDRAAIRSIRSQLVAEDTRLLSSLIGMLDEAQAADAAGWVAEAELTRLRQIATAEGWYGGARVDLDELMSDLLRDASVTVDAEQSEAVRAVLASWRAVQRGHLRKGADASDSVRVEVMEQVRDAGFAPDDESRDAMRVLGVAWDDAQQACIDPVLDAGRHTRATVRQLAAILGPESGARLTDAWVEGAVGGDAAVARGPVGRWIAGLVPDDAGRVGGLDPETSAAVLARAAAWEAALDRIVDTAIDLREARHGSMANRRMIFAVDNDDERQALGEEQQRRASDLLAERRDLDRRAAGELRRLIASGGVEPGAPMLAGLPDPASEPIAPSAPSRSSISVSTDGSATLTLENAPIDGVLTGFGLGERATTEAYLPRPLPAAALERWSALIGVDEGMQSLLEVMHEDYLADWAAMRREGAAGRARRRAAGLMAADAGANRSIPRASDVEAVFRERGAAVAELASVDEAFVGDLGAIADPDRVEAGVLERLRLERRRHRAIGMRTPEGSIIGRFAARGMMWDPDAPSGPEPWLDLAEIAWEALGDIAGTPADDVLREWELTAAAGLESLALETRTDLVRQYARFAAVARFDDDGLLQVEDLTVTAGERDLEANWTRAAKAARTSLRERRDAMATALRESGDDEAAARLLDVYRRRAHPDIYNDPTSVEPAFRRALAEPALDAEASATIRELRAAYRSAWSDLSRRMVESIGDWETRYRLSGDRTALNETTATRLARIRVESIGGS